MIDATFPHKVGVNKFKALCEAQNHRCAYCGVRCDGTRENDDDLPTIDHYVPLIAGGLRQWLNEVMACNLCNNGRGAMFAHAYYLVVRDRGRDRAAKYGRKKYSEQVKRKRNERARAGGQSDMVQAPGLPGQALAAGD